MCKTPKFHHCCSSSFHLRLKHCRFRWRRRLRARRRAYHGEEEHGHDAEIESLASTRTTATLDSDGRRWGLIPTATTEARQRRRRLWRCFTVAWRRLNRGADDHDGVKLMTNSTKTKPARSRAQPYQSWTHAHEEEDTSTQWRIQKFFGSGAQIFKIIYII